MGTEMGTTSQKHGRKGPRETFSLVMVSTSASHTAYKTRRLERDKALPTCSNTILRPKFFKPLPGAGTTL